MGSKNDLFSFSAVPDLVEWKSSLQLNSPVSLTHTGTWRQEFPLCLTRMFIVILGKTAV